MTEEVSHFELGTDGPTLILVAVDGSRTSLRAGAYAAGLARRQHCPLAVVYVTHSSAATGLDAGAAAAAAETARMMAADLEHEMQERIAALGIRADFHRRDGDPFSEIVAVADELRADAVVVGASEKAGHRLIGSLAARLVKAGRWPVTVVP